MPTSTLLYRSAGAWGAGIDRNLTPAEVDENFFELDQRLQDAEDNPAQPLQIASVTTNGSRMTITLSDMTTTFTVTLPVAAFKFTGDYQAGHAYKTNDVFEENGNIYLVLQDHESESEFTFGANTEGPFYALIMPAPNLYDIGMSFPGTPGLGIGLGEAMFTFRAVRPFYLPADLTGSVAGLQRSAAALMTIPIYKNETQIGTLSIGGADAESESDAEPESDVVWTFAAAVQFNAGDRLRFLRPTTGLDANAKDLSVNLAAVKGLLP